MAGGIHPPPEVIASWPKPNYVDPETRSGLVPIIVIFTVISVFMTGARLYVRGVHQRNFGIDDVLIAIAMVPTIALSICVCLCANTFYFDRHIWDVPPTSYVHQRQITFANEQLYVFSTALIKISILFFYRRLSPAAISKTYLTVIYVSIAFVAAYAVAFIFVTAFECSPSDAFWNQLRLDWIAEGREYTCVSEPISLLVASILSVIQDFLAALVPTYLFWTVKIPIRQKIALAAVFIIGFGTCIIGILRIYFIHVVFYQTYDLQWNTYPLWIVLSMECLVGSMCASAPPLKIFFRRLLQVRQGTSFFSSDRDASGSAKDTGDDSGRRSVPLAKRISKLVKGQGSQTDDDEHKLGASGARSSPADESEWEYADPREKETAGRVLRMKREGSGGGGYVEELQTSWFNGYGREDSTPGSSSPVVR